MLNEDVDLQVKMIALTKRLEELEAKGFHEVNAIYDNPIYMEQCSSCQPIEHEVSDCPTIPTMGKDLLRIIRTYHGIVDKRSFHKRQNPSYQLPRCHLSNTTHGCLGALIDALRDPSTIVYIACNVKECEGHYNCLIQ